VAKAKGDDVGIHFKVLLHYSCCPISFSISVLDFQHAREIAHTLRHMEVKRAKRLLVHVMQHKEAIPFRRFNYGIGHNAQGKAWKWAQSGFPVKAARVFLELLRNCESNARVCCPVFSLLLSMICSFFVIVHYCRKTTWTLRSVRLLTSK
jgi:hypothetical protein